MPTDGIQSRLEWLSNLSTTNAPQATQSTKYLRKVRSVLIRLPPIGLRLLIADRRLPSLPLSVRISVSFLFV
jgi:hypothetical protein